MAGARWSHAPRTRAFLRNSRVPWAGRLEDKHDDSVWAVTCFVTRVGFRKCGVCPVTTKKVILEELHVGTEGVFADAGLPKSAVRHGDVS